MTCQPQQSWLSYKGRRKPIATLKLPSKSSRSVLNSSFGPVDTQPFETNMIQACYYDDHVDYITLQGFNEDGRLTRISVQKAIEVGAETVYQDSARLSLANLIPTTDY
ncbi:hypothetical protein ACFXTH_018558 [Malus domestica]